MKNYYAQLDKAIKEHENNRPRPNFTIIQILERAQWCYKFKHITINEFDTILNRLYRLEFETEA